MHKITNVHQVNQLKASVFDNMEMRLQSTILLFAPLIICPT